VVCLTLTPTAALPGTTITVSGGDRVPGSTVTITFDNTVIGTTIADATGSFTTTVTIPADAASGSHTISASGGAAGCETSAMVLAEVITPAPPPALSFTGAHNVYGLAEIAAGLAFLGAVLVFATRRRREISRSRTR
jgi:hypothetical protein